MGDRSYSELKALESMGFTYEGWQEDKELAEGLYVFSLSVCLTLC